MRTRIGINAAPGAVMDWLSDPANARHWLAHIRHDADVMPDVDLTADADAMTVRWTNAPAGEMRVSGEGAAAEVTITFADTGHIEEPPAEEESPDDPSTNGANALRSIKSHVEGVGGGDATLHVEGIASREQVEEAARDPAS